MRLSKGAARQTETGFTRAVLAFARLHGWKCSHFRPARTADGGWRTPVQGDGKGWPDLFCVHPARGKAVVAELKVGRGKPTPEQRLWLAWLVGAGIPAFLWTPADWPQIETVLGGPA